MDSEVVLVVKELFSFIVAILCMILSKYRAEKNKDYANKYSDNTILLLWRLILTWMLKGLSFVILIGIIANGLDSFVVFYILTPILIALNLVFFHSDWIKGIFIFIKGLYYLGLAIISVVQYLLENQDVAELALGFTLALAIFESVTALSEGYSKISDIKRKSRKNRLV